MAAATHAADYAVDRYTVEAGGVATGDTYRVMGAAGQPDASNAMTGGVYAVTGGFYAHVSSQLSAAVLYRVDLVFHDGDVLVRWTSATEDDCAAYRVYRRDGQNWLQINGEVPASGGGSLYELVDAGAATGETYTYRIDAVDGSGGTETLVEFEREPFVLHFLVPVPVQDGNVLLRWPSRAGHTYHIWAATTAGDTYLLLDTVAATPPQNVHTQSIVGWSRFFRVKEYQD